MGERMDQGDNLGLSVSRGPLEHGCVFFKSHLVLEAQVLSRESWISPVMYFFQESMVKRSTRVSTGQ